MLTAKTSDSRIELQMKTIMIYSCLKYESDYESNHYHYFTNTTETIYIITMSIQYILLHKNKQVFLNSKSVNNNSKISKYF